MADVIEEEHAQAWPEMHSLNSFNRGSHGSMKQGPSQQGLLRSEWKAFKRVKSVNRASLTYIRPLARSPPAALPAVAS